MTPPTTVYEQQGDQVIDAAVVVVKATAADNWQVKGGINHVLTKANALALAAATVAAPDNNYQALVLHAEGSVLFGDVS